MRVKTEERRQAIIDTAKLLFCQQGFSNTSMSAIAKELGGSKATLYNYFSSKEEMFAAVMEASAVEIRQAFAQLKQGVELSTALNEFAVAYLKCVLSPDLIAIRKMATNESDHSGVGSMFYEKGPQRGWKLVADYLQQAIDNGKLKPGDSAIYAMHFKGLVESEVFDQVLFGVRQKPSREQLTSLVGRSVSVFLAAYQSN